MILARMVALRTGDDMNICNPILTFAGIIISIWLPPVINAKTEENL